MKLWLDDDLTYKPAPDGWVHVTSVASAKKMILENTIIDMDLDHDLSICGEKCHEREGGRIECDSGPPLLSSCPCECHDTGYDLVKWMAEFNHWPTNSIRIHSNNGPGRKNMMETIIHHVPHLYRR